MYKQLGRRFWGYTYQEMEKRPGNIRQGFSGNYEVETLGKTADKREIYCFILGRGDAGEKIFLFGAIHGREYIDQPASYGTDCRISYKTVPGRNL